MDGFEEELLSYKSQLLARAYHLCKDETRAEDLYQDSMEKALKYRDKFELGTNMLAWCYTIMRNTFINTYRKRKMGREKRDELYLLAQPDPNFEKKVQDEVIAKYEEVGLKELLKKWMTPKFYRAVTLFAEGKLYKEIAAIEDIPIGTVMSRMMRGRREAKEVLKNYYDNELMEEFIPTDVLEAA